MQLVLDETFEEVDKDDESDSSITKRNYKDNSIVNILSYNPTRFNN